MIDWDGARYAEVSGLQRMVAEESIADLALSGNERLLDVGCGDGFITMLLAERLPPDGSVVGVDPPSHRMIDRALARVPFDMLRVQFHVDNVLALPFEEDFDIAVSFNALHWVHEQGEALRQIARSLVGGGRAVLQMVCATERPSIEDVAMQVAADPRWSGSFEGFSAPYVHVEPSHFGDLAASRVHRRRPDGQRPVLAIRFDRRLPCVVRGWAPPIGRAGSPMRRSTGSSPR